MKRLDVFKCEVCGNIVTLQHVGDGELVCCGKPMVKLEEKTADKSTEKHVPVIEKTTAGYSVTVGTTLHPMTEEHYIQWIELVADGISYYTYLQAGDEPKADFCIKEANNLYAREYCNVHGLWKGVE